MPFVTANSTPSRGRWRLLHLLCLLLVTHGSLYPWQFAWPRAGFDAAWRELWSTATLWTGLGDVVGNVVLFVPVGLLMLLDLQGTRLPVRLRVPAMLAAGTSFAWVLQVVQIIVPERVPQLSDVVWNALGLLLGAVLAAAWRRRESSGAPADAAQALRWALLSAWLAIEWWPLLPTIDWQHIKDALKPLLLQPTWQVGSFVEAALWVVAAARLLAGTRRAGLWLTLLAGAALAGKLFVVDHALTLSRVSGVGFGLLVVLALRRLDPARSALWVVGAALLWLTVDELRPFEITEVAGEFHAIPFVSLLIGSMGANALSLLELGAWLGVVFVLAAEWRGRPVPLAAALSVWLLLLELLQVWLPGRVADITPALLPWFWVALLYSLGLVPARVSRLRRRSSAT
ncbi:MAG: VanZ family protein [Piscinibacter sp.]|uniref:VanZ family protein n=1 Tax=Piscinibacter sp. TaxID=1903157 RepID=UPI003D0A35A2